MSFNFMAEVTTCSDFAAGAKSLQSCPTLCDPIRWQPTRLPHPWDSPSKNTNHEIKRHLLLGRKVVTNLDSILKSRDITLPTKICLVKAMVSLVVMYGCESWTVKKAEH